MGLRERTLMVALLAALAPAAPAFAEPGGTSREMILSDPAAPVAGNPKGDVTIVAYLDYNCGFCKKSAPALEKLVKTDGRIRLVYKDWPILTETSDVGASWLLTRAPGEIGTYLGLTGEVIGAPDAIYAGLADRLVPSASLPALVDALAALPTDVDHDGVRAAIDAFAEPPGASPLESQRPIIDACFAFDSVEDILAALDADGSDFAAQTRAVLASRSPTGLVATLAMLRLGREAASLEECLERDYRMGLALFAEKDFREGIRALLIDKDRAPRWDPPTLDALPPGKVQDWLAPRAAPLFAREPA